MCLFYLRLSRIKHNLLMEHLLIQPNMQKGFFMFSLNSSQQINNTTKQHDSTVIEISILQKLLKKTQNENQLHKANIQRLLESHKQLTSLAKKLIQTIETEKPALEKQASLARQIRLFKRNMDF